MDVCLITADVCQTLGVVAPQPSATYTNLFLFYKVLFSADLKRFRELKEDSLNATSNSNKKINKEKKAKAAKLEMEKETGADVKPLIKSEVETKQKVLIFKSVLQNLPAIIVVNHFLFSEYVHRSKYPTPPQQAKIKSLFRC